MNNLSLPRPSIIFEKIPVVPEIVLFSCDDVYFKKFGIYNICSCDVVGHDIHFHIINPSLESLNLFKIIKDKLKINVSFSTERLYTDQLVTHSLISYYYCSRFYIASVLLEEYNVKKIHIVDADMIFNDKVCMNDDIHLSLEYNKEYNNLWQKIMAGYIFITAEKISFLKEVMLEYQKRYESTDFSQAMLIEDKIEKANLIALDQVCLSYIFEKENLEKDPHFYNLLPLKKLYKSKGDNEAKMWMILGKTKNNVESYLKEKFKSFFYEI